MVSLSAAMSAGTSRSNASAASAKSPDFGTSATWPICDTSKIAQPSRLERWLIMIGQLVFYNVYFWTYLFFPKMAHRIVGYLEEEAVVSYTQFLEEIDAGKVENVPAPEIAKEYWGLPDDARLRDVVIVIRADEAEHRDTNHDFANRIASGDHP